MNWNAYHFTGNTLRDGSPIPPNGEMLVFTEPLNMCAAGYHASRDVWDALKYAPGHMLHRVHCGGEVIDGDEKLVCSERTIVASINAEALLREFARSCARDVLHLWDAPDVVREYLKTGAGALKSAAESAARSAAESGARSGARWVAWSAARSAAESVAWSAAESAARSAAWSAARSVAWSAAESAARLAARLAAESTQRERFTNMVNAAFEAQS